jgi:hypothetical protein
MTPGQTSQTINLPPVDVELFIDALGSFGQHSLRIDTTHHGIYRSAADVRSVEAHTYGGAWRCLLPAVRRDGCQSMSHLQFIHGTLQTGRWHTVESRLSITSHRSNMEQQE